MKRSRLVALFVSVFAPSMTLTIDKYPGYENERVKTAIQGVDDELKK